MAPLNLCLIIDAEEHGVFHAKTWWAHDTEKLKCNFVYVQQERLLKFSQKSKIFHISVVLLKKNFIFIFLNIKENTFLCIYFLNWNNNNYEFKKYWVSTDHLIFLSVFSFLLLLTHPSAKFWKQKNFLTWINADFLQLRTVCTLD